jgi:hypothetical protein
MPLKSLSLLSLLISSSVYAWDRGLASCDDVDCPPLKETGPAAGCNIVNRTYQIVGISNFSSQIAPEGQNLTWTVGVKARDGLGEEGHDRVVEKGFYLGTPPGLELKPYGNATLPFQGCAVILNTNKTTYPDRGSWACPDVIGEDCYSQLLDSMTEYVEDAPRNETTEQTCQELVQRAVSRGSACEDLLRDDTWSHMQAIRKQNGSIHNLPMLMLTSYSSYWPSSAVTADRIAKLLFNLPPNAPEIERSDFCVGLQRHRNCQSKYDHSDAPRHQPRHDRILVTG